MGLLDFVGGIFKPAGDIVDNLHTSAEEKMLLQNEMLRIQTTFALKVLEYEQAVLTSKKDIIVAEAQSQSFLARSWRPITMLSLLLLVMCDSFGWLPNKLGNEAWLLIQIGLGGYLGGKSLENLAPKIVQAAKSGTKTTIVKSDRRGDERRD
jgi:hypothetical protein